MAITGVITDIKRYAVYDGPGIRTTVFLKGCPLHCFWCHNPEAISPEEELMFFDQECLGCFSCVSACPEGAIKKINGVPRVEREQCSLWGKCAQACPTGALEYVGRRVTAEELLDELERDIQLFDSSGGGITFSGGEPLFQYEFLKEMLLLCKQRNINTLLDTSGYASREKINSLLDLTDYFYYDLKIMDDKKHREYTGVSSKPSRENLKFLVEKGRAKDISIRVPVIPGITDTEKNIGEIIDFMISLEGLNRVDLLPFHDVGEKYSRLGRVYKLPEIKAPTRNRLEEIKTRFEQSGILAKY